MSRPVVLDTGPLGMVTHPKADDETKKATEWLLDVLKAGTVVYVPEIADYELRRELVRAGKARGIAKLDQLTASLKYLPITTQQMRRAATIWAEMRNKGKPTANDAALDGDVILVAQAESIASDDEVPIIATTNAKHLGEMADAVLWDDMLTGSTSAP